MVAFELLLVSSGVECNHIWSLGRQVNCCIEKWKVQVHVMKMFLVSRQVHAGFLPGADIDTITVECPVSDLTQNAKTWWVLMGGGHLQDKN